MALEGPTPVGPIELKDLKAAASYKVEITLETLNGKKEIAVTNFTLSKDPPI